MKKSVLNLPSRLIAAGMLLLYCAGAEEARAAVTYWDPTGATASATPDGNWEDLAWSTGNYLTNGPVGWVPGTAAGFSAGTSATGAFTVNLNSAQNVAGIFNGLTASIGTVTITGTGSMSMPAGQQGFYTVAPGVTIINVPLTGPAQVVMERTGNIYLNGTNTYTGGTQLGFSSAAFTGTVYINNSASFGTGPITMYSAGCTIAATGTSPITIPNTVIAAAVNMSISGIPAGLTFGGPWSLSATPSIGSGVVGSPVIISGVMSGAGGLNKYNPGMLRLDAINTYTGATTVSNGSLALGTAGSINNTTSITLVPGANGTVFDVSLNPTYAIGAATTLIARGAGIAPNTAAMIKGAVGGSVSLGVRPVGLNFTPTIFTGDTAHPALYVTQGSLKFSNNTISVTNAAATALGVGNYRLIQVGNGVSGVISGTPNVAVTVQGAGIVAKTTASLVVSNGNVNLVVKTNAIFSSLTNSQSNTFGIGATTITLSGKIGAGVLHPVKGETIGLTINGVAHNTSVSDTSGDFSYSFDPSLLAYSGTGYNVVYSYAGNASLGAPTNTTYAMALNPFFVDDSLPGFFSGLNLFCTNTAGVSMSTWSTTNAGLPVTDWTLEAVMQEQPLNDGSGKSRYSINVNPVNPLVYYISGPTQNWPHLSPAGVQWIVTDSSANQTYFTTNVSITAAGVLGFALPPVVIQQSASQTVTAGKNANFSVLATGSQPLNYQWYFNTTMTPPGISTNALLTVTNVSGANAGNYLVVVTNQYGTSSSTSVVLSVVPPPQLGAQMVTNGFQFSGQGIAGNPYWVQMATNLNPPVSWLNVATNTADTNGQVQFTDTGTATNSGKFYRLSVP
jgi:autotransporter-associated beta strand protein